MLQAATRANRGVTKVRVLLGTERFSSQHSWSELIALMPGALGATVEVHRLSSSLPKAHEEEPLPLPDFQIERADFHDGGFKVFPTSQPGGHGLAVLLDAESQFSVHRVAELRIDWRPGTLYPIARIL